MANTTTTLPPVTAQAPPSTTTTDPYGLGAWQDKPVTVGNLFPVAAKDGNITANSVLEGFTHADATTIAGIQRDLLLGGFYGGSSSYQPTFGVLHPEDIKAFANATQVAAQTGTALDQYLSSAAKFGAQAGGAAAQVNFETITHELRQADPATLHNTLDRAFTQALGRRATDAERASFVAAFTTKDLAQQQAGFNAADSARAGYIGRQQAAADAKAAGTNQAGLLNAAPADLLSPGQLDTGRRGHPDSREVGSFHDTITSADVTAYGAAFAHQFGLSVTSQFRSAGAAAALGTEYSDHIGGMALDLGGDPAHMQALYAWAKANEGPGRLFRYVEPWDQSMATNSHNTGPHVHVSFNSSINANMAPTVDDIQTLQMPSAGQGANGVVATITAIANELGVDPRLALAIAQKESSLNPMNKGDFVGGNPTSFGLFQLHKGGELGNLTPEQAYDPATNARVALTQVAAVARAHPDWTPGQIAAAAQRPADPAGYAVAVNGIYSSGSFSGGGAGAGASGSIPLSQTITTTAVDPTAQALETARTQHPVEAGAHDISDQYANFLQIIGASAHA